ncbi:MAG: maltose alpha-D-glucosyltransferase / alpha-amylase [Gaiellales bacterium]|jgi:maltose alpha-D-glucosyltransferase/alpha-amylase|nr:maltose alpha-D-glucosyltransferase / alpha-amylase [Gaiellales bacterium]
MTRPEPRIHPAVPEDTAPWYQNAIIYQLHVRAFQDSNDDGIGDFRGLTQRLDYLQDLGVTTLWLLPFYPSPLRDDGYDTADYRGIHPSYGTMRDFKTFLRQAHDRGLRVITELVLNHTSDEHAWFQRARRAPAGSPERDFYVWSDTPDRWQDARIIFQDFESSNWSWDPVAGAYYWHRFYSHQPDLNWDNPAVKREMFSIVDFWLEMGVDGLRLDAVPYLIERDGTNCENLPETHQVLKDLRAHVDERFPDRMLLAEANQWPEDAVAYFGDGDECHMAFHFPLMPRMFMSVRMEDRYPLVDIVDQTPQLPDKAQWAIFLRNHDELTLEMVTDEERDYMYRVYAQDPQARINLGIRRRLAPLLGNDRRLMELVNALLLSLPGTPVVYYGDEVGMGDNIYLGDRNSVRTPMQWSSDRNGGFSRANPQRLYLPVISDPEYGSVNVEAQQNSPSSLLWWMKRMIALRKRHPAFHGSLEFLFPENRKVLAFLRELGDDRLLVVANLSRRVQYAELDVRRLDGLVPEELMGHSEFPPFSADRPYVLTLGPHDVFLFALHPPSSIRGHAEAPTIRVSGAWPSVFERRPRGHLEDALTSYLPLQRWFASKARRIRKASVAQAIRLGAATGEPAGYLCIVDVEFSEGEPESYVLPIVARRDQAADDDSIAVVRCGDVEVVLQDGAGDPAVARALLDAIRRRRRLAGRGGAIEGTPERSLRKLLRGQDIDPSALGTEQSNTSIAFGPAAIMKLFRKLEPGVNPEAELTGLLLEQEFPHAPMPAGTLEFRPTRGDAATVAVLQSYVPNEGNAWSFALDEVGRFLDNALVRESGPATQPPVDPLGVSPPEEAHETIGGFLEVARLLGQRTGELHLALAAAPGSDAPEPYSALQQRSLLQSMRTLVRQTFRSAKKNAPDEAASLPEREDAVLGTVRELLAGRLGGKQIRTHGDFHLGQVLWTGRDVVFIDFEGEPARTLGQRRLKRSPIRDVAGMLRSFHYAAYAGLYQELGWNDPTGGRGEAWILFWRGWVSAAYLRGYRDATAGSDIVPEDDGEFQRLLRLFAIEKCVYEIGYELNNRPDWLHIPIRGLDELLDR